MLLTPLVCAAGSVAEALVMRWVSFLCLNEKFPWIYFLLSVPLPQMHFNF